MSALQKSVLKSKLPPIGPIGLSSSRNGRRAPGKKRDYNPVRWDQYFENCEDVKVDDDTFRVYYCGTEGPLLLLLHGGGFSALTWSLFSSCVTDMVECRILAIDLRGHGDTFTSDDDDLAAETLANDVGKVIRQMYEDDPPPIILIGHSMGGAIAVHVANAGHIPSLIGLAVIDVVEGTAMDALASMQSVLRSRPTHFKSLQHAIEWCVRSGQVRNSESAKVSMPGQIKNCTTNKPATNDIDALAAASPADGEPQPLFSVSNPHAIMEEDGETGIKPEAFKAPFAPDEVDKHKYTWRIELAKTEKHWPGWFKGLSNMFLSSQIPKLLLLAGIDRLDKELTVGQMQGKFQMQVLPQCGHAVHEDVPDRVAEVLSTFMVRHKFAEPKANFVRSMPAC